MTFSADKTTKIVLTSVIAPIAFVNVSICSVCLAASRRMMAAVTDAGAAE